MTRKINTNKLVALLAVLCMITSAFVGSTLAKYTSEATGTDSARVAKWAFDMDGATGTDVNVLAFNLFDTIVDTVDSLEDNEVADNVIAPGTKGSFDIVLKNNSEVDATYAIDFTPALNNVPLQFKVTGDVSTADTDYVDGTLTSVTALNIDMGETKTITVEWQWPFFVNDTADGKDTILGLDGTITAEVEATVTVEQRD